LQKIDWHYRIIGSFAAPDYARGSYAVALTLRALSLSRNSQITWSTGLKLNEANCEIDFVAWHQPSGFLREEREGSTVVFGEVKSHGLNSVDDKAVNSLKNIADRFPGAVMVFSALREIENYLPGELQLLRDLAVWGRSRMHEGLPRNPLIILTGTELFADHSIYEKWERDHWRREQSDLFEIAELTQRKYLGLKSFWE
jgi:hypothetical protein